MHIVVNGILCGFFWGLEQGSNIHVKSDIRKGRCNDFGATVVTVLSHFHNQHTGTAAFFLGKTFDRFLDRCEIFITFVSGTINPGKRFYFGSVTSEYIFHCH